MKRSKKSARPVPRREASATPPKPASPGYIGASVTAFFLMLLFIRIPRTLTTPDLDPSWGVVLDFAHAHKLQFGTDIVFTYGPLGYLAIEWFIDRAPLLRMLFDVMLDFSIAAGVCLVAWRTRIGWRLFLLAVFVLLPASIRPGYFDVPTEIGLFCWTLLCLVETQPRIRYYAAVLVIVAAVLSMIKFTLLLITAISILTVAGNFVLRNKIRLACALFLGYVAGVLGLWVCSGQSLSHLGAYFINSLAISTGYEDSMGYQFNDTLWTAGVLLGGLSLAAAAIRLRFADEPANVRSWLRRALILAWLFCILFLAWKHGFLRAKSDLWAGFAVLVALALEVLPVCAGRRIAIWAARGCAIACCLLALWIEHWDDKSHYDDFAGRTAGRFCDNVSALLDPAAYVRTQTQSLDAERARDQLPTLDQIIGTNTVDVFGQNQAYAWFNGLNYHPRLVFQNYTSYNAALMALNERFYTSDAAPKFVLFNFGTIDGRFPAMEDARVLRDLLADYTLVGAEPPFLLLKHQTNSVPQMTLLHEGSVSENERISVAEYGDADLWLEITLTPTLEGRLREIFYKPSEAYLTVWDQSLTHQVSCRAPVSMLAAGFLASPLVFRPQDALNLYMDKAVVRPGGYAIRLQDGTAGMWQPQIHYRLYRIDTRLGRNSTPDPAFMNLPSR